MKIVCIGDSLTQGDYGVFGKSGIANVHRENYPFFLSQILDAEVENLGRCGRRPSTYLDFYIENGMSLENPDLILVMLGTNGGLDDTVDTPDNKAYLDLLDRVKKDAPNAKIVLCTPPHATENPKCSNFGYAPQVKKAVKFIRNLCRAQGFLLVDLADCSDFTAENEEIMQPNDGLHYGEKGYKIMAEFIAAELKKQKII